MGGLRIAIPAALLLLAGCGEAPRGAQCVALPEAWRTPEGGIGEGDRPNSRIGLHGREVRWDGTIVTFAQLHGYLAQSGKVEWPPALVLTISDDADCDVVREVIADMKRAPICRDHDQCGTIERWPEFYSPPPPDENVEEGK